MGFLNDTLKGKKFKRNNIEYIIQGLAYHKTSMKIAEDVLIIYNDTLLSYSEYLSDFLIKNELIYG
jgi:hypothetical protein